MEKSENMKYLLNPKSIAILGCSENNVGGAVLQNLLRNGFEGGIYPVHPRNDYVGGVKCYRSLLDIPNPVDVCVVALNSQLVLQSIEDMRCKGIKAAVLLASGFSETGFEGSELEQKVATKLSEYNIVACGPNSLGLINLHANAVLYSAACDLDNLKGKIGLVSHSGSVCIAFMSAMCGRGFSYVVSSGNETNLDVADYFRMMVDDPETEVLVGFLETIRDPVKFKEVAMLAFRRNKPIVILDVGRCKAGREAVAAHSGALACPGDITHAYFKQNNILQANSFDEICEVCELLLQLKDQPLPVTSGVGLTAISGGQLAFCCDVASQENVIFPKISEQTEEQLRNILPSYATAKNPLDVTTAMFELDQYKGCIRALASDDNVGLIMICQDAEEDMYVGEIEIYKRIVEAIAEIKDEIDIPIVVFSPLSAGLIKEFGSILNEKGIPLMKGAHESFAAVRLYNEWSNLRTKMLHEEPGPSVLGEFKMDFPKRKYLTEHESKNILEYYGIRITEEILVQKPEDAVCAASQLGYPVAMKIVSPDLPHKTEAGGILLNLGTETEVREAYDQLLSNSLAFCQAAEIDGILVQEMVSDGIQILIGGKTDPLYGPTVMVGMGGIFTEIYDDYALRLAPIDLATAFEMINSLKGKDLLYGTRGSPRSDVQALADALVKVGVLMHEQSDWISELDVNPVMVLPEGQAIKAVDALIVTQHA